MRQISYKCFWSTGALRNSNHSTHVEADGTITYWTSTIGQISYRADRPAGPA